MTLRLNPLGNTSNNPVSDDGESSRRSGVANWVKGEDYFPT
jgi:hypothetical protein